MFLVSYKQNNPESDAYDIKGIKSDMEQLIKEKDRLFPDVKIGIAQATIYENDTEYRIIAAAIPIGEKNGV